MTTTRQAGRLVLLGVNHNTAPIEMRERLVIPAARLADATRSLLHQPGVREGLILSTCNRVEIVTVQQQEAGGDDSERMSLLQFLHEYCAVPPSELTPHLYELRESEAVRHLFRVASSLDSMVVGEPQILGQVKESYTIAREVGAMNGALDALLQRAFTVAKKVRSETRIGTSSVSIASVAVDLARKIFGSLHGRTVLLVGAGKMSELAARHLIQHGATKIVITNRTRERAERLAAEFAGAGRTTEVVAFEELHEATPQADIVLTSTGSPAKLFGRADAEQFLHARRNRPMFFIDIAVPRDVDPSMNEVEGCFVYDIDDLQGVAASHQANRSREAQAAESIIAAEVDRYQQRLQEREAAPAIRLLQQSAEALREQEMKRTEARLAAASAALTPEQREAVETLTRSLTAKLLHSQIAALRGGGGTESNNKSGADD